MMQELLNPLCTTMQIMSGHSAAPSCPLETTAMELVPAPDTPSKEPKAPASPTASAATATPTLPVEVLHRSSVIYVAPSSLHAKLLCAD